MKIIALITSMFLHFSSLVIASNNEPMALIEKWLTAVNANNLADYADCFHSYTMEKTGGFGQVFASEEALSWVASQLSEWKENGFTFSMQFEHIPLGDDEAPPEWGSKLVIAKLSFSKGQNQPQFPEIFMAYDNQRLAILGYRMQ